MSIIIFGDSLCAGLVVDNAHIESFSGYTTEQLLNMDYGLKEFLREDKYEKVVFLLGSNDLGNYIDVEDSKANIKRLIDICEQHNKERNDSCLKYIVVLGLPVEEKCDEIFDNMLEDACRVSEKSFLQVVYCDILESIDPKWFENDGRHFNVLGKGLISLQLDSFLSGLS